MSVLIGFEFRVRLVADDNGDDAEDDETCDEVN